MKCELLKYLGRDREKHCGACNWHVHEDIDDGFICANDTSPKFADWTEDDDSCEAWEGAEE